MNWITELLDEYPTNRSDSAIQRLRIAYANEPSAVMDLAVVNYMKDGNEFFPRVASLAKYVDAARVDQNTWGAQWLPMIEQAKAENDFIAVDDIIMSWERQRNPEFGATLEDAA